MFTSIRLIAVSLVAPLALATLSGCAGRAAPRDFAGKVVDDTVVLQVPALSVPSVDLDAGFAPGEVDGGSSGARRSTVATAVALTGLGSVVRVTGVSAKAGEIVGAGQEIARLDSATLDAHVAIARATLATARAQVGLLSDALDAVESNRSTLASKRAEINDAAAQLTATRVKLASQLADMQALLAKIDAARAGGSGAPGGGAPNGTPPPGALPEPAKLRAGIAQLTAALAKIDAGLAKVSAGRVQLASARAKLADARIQLRDLRVLARVAADAAEVGAQLAEYQRELTVMRSPVDGVVVSVVSVGEVLSPGAAVAVIRRREAPRVTTWIAPEELDDVRVGSAAEVSADWFGVGVGAIRGRVSSIGTRAEYPPTAFATDEIHLTRAVPVEITLRDAAERPALPPGAPVDVRFLGK